jgi:hypothetical protein
LEEHVTHSQEEQTSGRRDRGELPPRLEFAQNLSRRFLPSTVIVTCIKMIKYVQSLPVEKGKVADMLSFYLSVKFEDGMRSHDKRKTNGECVLCHSNLRSPGSFIDNYDVISKVEIWKIKCT